MLWATLIPVESPFPLWLGLRHCRGQQFVLLHGITLSFMTRIKTSEYRILCSDLMESPFPLWLGLRHIRNAHRIHLDLESPFPLWLGLRHDLSFAEQLVKMESPFPLWPGLSEEVNGFVERTDRPFASRRVRDSPTNVRSKPNRWLFATFLYD